MKLDTAALLADPHVADGSISTQLVARGFPPGRPAEMASLESPDLVAALAEDYIRAGARFLTTNTFSANRFRLKGADDDRTLREVNLRGAALLRPIADEHDACVVGSIGPSGKLLVVKEAPEEELAASFRLQAEALTEGGVDAIVLETFSELAEIELAIAAVRSACDLPIIASMSFESGPQRTRTMMGVKADDCACTLDEEGADVIGCNCGSGIADVLPVVVAMRASTKRPLWVKPNAGLPELDGTTVVYKQTPEEYAAHVPPLVEAGANIIGGCCGTTPEHIRRVALALRK